MDPNSDRLRVLAAIYSIRPSDAPPLTLRESWAIASEARKLRQSSTPFPTETSSTYADAMEVLANALRRQARELAMEAQSAGSFAVAAVSSQGGQPVGSSAAAEVSSHGIQPASSSAPALVHSHMVCQCQFFRDCCGPPS
jgi:hypothetical protein